VQGPTKYDIVYDIRQKVNTQAVQGRYYPPRRQSRGGGSQAFVYPHDMSKTDEHHQT